MDGIFLHYIANVYFITVAIVWIVSISYGVFTHRHLGYFVALNYVLTGATAVSVFWPFVVANWLYDFATEG